MYLGVIADDFTGASDVANTLTKGGLSTVQLLGLPRDEMRVDYDACVVALKTRSIRSEEAVEQSLAALRWLRAQGCRQHLFKYCSTFDSTPAGNIGPVGEALARELNAWGVPACPAFPTTGRTVYQGHLFVGDRLLSESGMEHHPLNPMTDPDIRRWLQRQCREPVGLIAWPTVRKGSEAIRKTLAASSSAKERLVIIDAVDDADLYNIGEAAGELPLLSGGSGIALGLPRNLLRKGLATGITKKFSGVQGPEVILAGSCSRATLGQIETHRRDHPTFAVEISEVMKGGVTAAALAAFANRHAGKAPLIYSSAAPDEVKKAQDKYGRETVSARLEDLFAQAALELARNGIQRMVIAGGETSGSVVNALGIRALEIGPEIDPGVPALASVGDRPMALALKSGNFGGPDFFTKALRVLEGKNA